MAVSPFHRLQALLRKNISHLSFFFMRMIHRRRPIYGYPLQCRNVTGNIHFVPTLTRIAPGLGGWKGTTGPLNAQMLSNCISNLQNPIHYVAAPPDMAEGTHQTLVELPVREEDIPTESFAGY